MPYVCTSVFDASDDEYSDVFGSRRVDDETLRLALADWDM